MGSGMFCTSLKTVASWCSVLRDRQSLENRSRESADDMGPRDPFKRWRQLIMRLGAGISDLLTFETFLILCSTSVCKAASIFIISRSFFRLSRQQPKLEYLGARLAVGQS